MGDHVGNNMENGHHAKPSNDGNTDELEKHILRRFEIQDRLGKGAYGIVWKAFDRKENRIVALKKIFDAFGNGQDAQRTFREVCFLTSFSVHPNIIKLTDIIRAENKNDLYLSFEYMPTDLHALIKSKSGLQDVHIRYIMAQLFRTIFFIHSANVIHRDLKPANILLTHPCEIRVADFGLARSLSDPDDNFQNGNLTNYVATRWYRSPEILLGSKRYTKGVDVWSLGTILAEMLRAKPLFTGENTIEQINFIRGALSEPTTQDLRYCDSGLVRSVFNYPPHRDFRRPLEHYLRGAPPDAIDLIRRLLHWDPDRRIDLMKAMRHPYVNGFYDPQLVYISDISVTPFISDDKHFEDPSVYREALYEILHVKEIVQTPKSQPNPQNAPPNIRPRGPVQQPELKESESGTVTLRSESPEEFLEYQPVQTPIPDARKKAAAEKTKKTSTAAPPPAPPPVAAPAPVQTLKRQNSAPITPPHEQVDTSQAKDIPYGEPVGPGGTPVKHATTVARPLPRPPSDIPRTIARRRFVTNANVEQPAIAYKTANSGSNGSLTSNLPSNPSQPNLAAMAVEKDGQENNVGRKVVKFEDEIAAQSKKNGKVKANQKAADGGATNGGSFAKRFSFDGRSIRDRLPYVKRSNSLVRRESSELHQKQSTIPENRAVEEKKSFKETMRNHVPDFLRRGSIRKSALQTSMANGLNGQGDANEPTGAPGRGRVSSFSTTTSSKPVFPAQGTPGPSRRESDNYGTLKNGMLQNLKGYSRA